MVDSQEVFDEKYAIWKKKRTFVRAVEGVYKDIKDDLYNAPRVVKGKEFVYKGGPQFWNKHILAPKDGLGQTIESHIEVFSPGGRSQKHGHLNGAVFVVLHGKGYDVHDGVRHDWEAGDIAIVENGCVHQHFNASDTEMASCLVVKGKPLYLFFNLLFQRNVIDPPKEPVPGYEDWDPGDLPY